LSSNQILLFWGDPKERQALYKILCATGAEVHFADPQSDIPRAVYDKCRLVVVDYDTVRDTANNVLQQVARQGGRPAVLVVTATRDKRDLLELLAHDVLTNLVAKNTDLKATELVVTVQKIMRSDVFGLEKYLTWGALVHEVIVKSSDQKNPLVEDVGNYLTSIGCNKRLVGLARGVIDEFVMNAVYNAPVDKKGVPKYATRSRSERVDLLKNEEVRFRYACDGRLLALSVEDNFGRLEPSTVLNYLRKCFMRGDDQIDKKQGGAGLGLYYIFESLNQFIINVQRKKRTEMIGIMDISGSYRDFAEQPKSLNIFIQEESK
jgi:hypothetical protein